MSVFNSRESFPERISRLADELYKTRRTLNHVRAELASERKSHERTKTERDELSAKVAEFEKASGPTFCPGTGRTDHAEHSILCFSKVA